MGGLGESNFGAFVFLAIVALTILILLMRTHRQLRRRSRQAASVAPARPMQTASERRPAPPSDQFARWEVEMHELARELMGQLNSKIVVVERLIADAQRAAARLEAAGSAVRTPESPICTAAPVAPMSQPAPLHQQRPDQAAALGTRRDATTMDTDRFPLAPRGAAGDSRRYEAIYRLADSGQSSSAIAAQTGAPVGEVELILSLRANI